MGTIMLKNVRYTLHPSMAAASSISTGMLRKKAQIIKIALDIEKAA